MKGLNKKSNRRMLGFKHFYVPMFKKKMSSTLKSCFMFLFKLMEGFLPALLIVMFRFIFSNLFAGRYVDQLDRFKLLPNKNIVVLDLILGLLVAFGWCNFTSYSAVCRKTVRIVAKCNCSLPANDLSFFCSSSDRQFRRFDK